MDPDKFLKAQAPVIETVLRELREGRKHTDWMWFIFPQLKGLAQSSIAKQYELNGLQDAREWLTHPELSSRLFDCTKAVLLHSGKSIKAIMDSPDNLKLRSSMTLFHLADPDQPLFSDVLRVFYRGRSDSRTIHLL